MKARTQYKPPKLKKPPKIPPRDPDVRKNGVNGVRFSEVGNEEGNDGVGNVNGLNGNGRKLNGRTGSRRFEFLFCFEINTKNICYIPFW